MSWSSQRKSLISSGLLFYVRCRTTNMMLGTQPNNPDIHREFIASKNPDPLGIEEEVKANELAVNTAIGNDQELEDIQMTIFPRAVFAVTDDGKYYDPEVDVVPEGCNIVNLPFLYDYQWRGSFKESIGMLNRADTAKGGTYAASSITAHKKVVDGTWFVTNRKIPLFIPETFTNMMGEEITSYDDHGNLRTLSRPLRADTAKGPRTALATSEIVPAGTEFYFGIRLLNENSLKACIETLDYKEWMGMLQWRGGGKGTLEWTLCNRDGVPYDDLEEEDLTATDKEIIGRINKIVPNITKFGDAFDSFAPKKAAAAEKKAKGAKKTDDSDDGATEAPKKRGRPKKKAEGEE